MNTFRPCGGLFSWLPILLAGLGVWGAACRTSPDARPATEPALERFEFTQPQMGVPFRIVLYTTNAAHAEQVAGAAFDRVRQLNGVMSDYEAESELSRLSASAGSGQAVAVSPELWTVLTRSQRLARASAGAFDVTVGPFVNLWRRARRVKALPPPDQLREAAGRVGSDKLVLDERHRTARLLVPGMKLDLGGIAKGYAVDEALRVIRAAGISRALVSGVGDIAAGDPPPGRFGWRVGVAQLDVPGAPTNRFVLLRNAAVSTSGDSAQRLEIDGRRYSHIVDARTGVGLIDHSLVTVIAPDCMTSDSIATAVSVLGPRDGLRLVRSLPGVEVRIVREPGSGIEVIESRRFARFYE